MESEVEFRFKLPSSEFNNVVCKSNSNSVLASNLRIITENKFRYYVGPTCRKARIPLRHFDTQTQSMTVVSSQPRPQ